MPLKEKKFTAEMIKALVVSTWTDNGYLSMCNYAPSMQSASRGGVKVPLTLKLKEYLLSTLHISRLYGMM